MRGALIQTLIDLAARDERVLLLTADLGYTVVEPFRDRYPRRFFNVGVAEQNMLGVATGLAEAGFVPFVYSIATFAALRPFEFIRNGPVLHGLPVRIVGVGGGFDYGSAGITHHALEDLGCLRTQPGLTVLAPADHQQARAALMATWDLPGPVYYRLGKDDKAVVPGLDGRFALGRAATVRTGDDLLLITTGAIATETAAAAELLAQQGVNCTVVVAACLQPAPVADLVEVLGEFGLALTVEAHYVTGGLGSLVAEVIAEHGIGCRLVRCGVRAAPDGITGSQAFLQHRHGLSAQAVAEIGLAALSGARR